MLNQEQVEKIAIDVFNRMSTQSQFNVSPVPSHTHNGTDTVKIPPTSVTNFAPLSGFKSGTVGDTSGVLSSDNIGVATPPYPIIYPVPVIPGYGVGSFSQFNGGSAPFGAMVLFENEGIPLYQLWVRLVDGVGNPLWVGTGLTASGGSGGGSPGGSDTQVQFNDSGSFGGASGIAWDSGSGNIIVGDSGGPSAAYITTPSGLETRLLTGDGVNGGQVWVGANQPGTAGGTTKILSGDGSSANDNGGEILIVPGVKHGSGAGGDVVVGGSIVTTATGGFLVIPHCAGAPTGVPHNGQSMVFDTSNNKLYVYNGAWKSVTLT